MSPKNNTKVLIGGTVYTLSGEESEEYIQRVALYINNKMDNLKQSDNGQQLNTRLMNVLLAINIADDLFKERDEIKKIADEVAGRDQTIEELKERLADKDAEKAELSTKISELENVIQSYKKELDEYIEIFEESN